MARPTTRRPNVAGLSTLHLPHPEFMSSLGRLIGDAAIYTDARDHQRQRTEQRAHRGAESHGRVSTRCSDTSSAPSSMRSSSAVLWRIQCATLWPCIGPQVSVLRMRTSSDAALILQIAFDHDSMAGVLHRESLRLYFLTQRIGRREIARGALRSALSQTRQRPLDLALDGLG